ncbi:MAG: HNH endonuclease [Ekhidna sp.]|nr:HNH endonuclease [Ekhidna sp.]
MTSKKKETAWAPTVGFSNYEISNKGKIRSKARSVWHKGSKTHMKLQGKLMKQRWNKICKCYFLDLVNDEGERRTIYSHKETAKAFVPKNRKEFTMIIHKDNNPRNNYFENLEWKTKSGHMK